MIGTHWEWMPKYSDNEAPVKWLPNLDLIYTYTKWRLPERGHQIMWKSRIRRNTIDLHSLLCGNQDCAMKPLWRSAITFTSWCSINLSVGSRRMSIISGSPCRKQQGCSLVKKQTSLGQKFRSDLPSSGLVPPGIWSGGWLMANTHEERTTRYSPRKAHAMSDGGTSSFWMTTHSGTLNPCMTYKRRHTNSGVHLIATRNSLFTGD